MRLTIPLVATRRQIIGVWIVVACAALFAYWPALRGDFIWDDFLLLRRNPMILQPGLLWQFWFTHRAPDYFPLTSTSFWIEWRMWGDDPLGYHVTNVLLHAGSAVMMWRLLRRLEITGAGLAALIFLLHPMHVQSVAWIAERKNTLSTFFALTALVAFDRASQRGRVVAWWSLLFFTLGLLAKTAVVMAPFWMLMIDLKRHRRINRRSAIRVLPFLIVALFLSLVTIHFQSTNAIGSENVRDDGFSSRLVNAGAAVWWYAAKILWPVHVRFVEQWKALNPSNFTAWMPGLAVFGLMAALLILRRKVGLAPAALWCGFVIALFPVLGFFNIYFMRYAWVSDHWGYFPSIALCTLIGMTLSSIGARTPRAMQISFACLLLCLIGSRTWMASRSYQSEERLWRDTIQVNSRAWMARNNLATILIDRGDDAEAMREIDASIHEQPLNQEAWLNRGLLAERRGDLIAAEENYRHAVTIAPHYDDGFYNLGALLAQTNRRVEAESAYRQALELNPRHLRAMANLASLCIDSNRIDEALTLIERGLKLDPANLSLRSNLASALYRRGDVQSAAIMWEQLLREDDSNAIVWNNRGTALIQLGRVDDAIISFDRAVKLKPDFVLARQNLERARKLKTGPMP